MVPKSTCRLPASSTWRPSGNASDGSFGRWARSSRAPRQSSRARTSVSARRPRWWLAKKLAAPSTSRYGTSSPRPCHGSMRWTPTEPAPDLTLTRAVPDCLPYGRLAGPRRASRPLESTQAVARAWADEGGPEGAVVLADYQAAGRGQHGRRWTAPAGAGLLFSVVLRPQLPVARWPEIPIAAGCAI